MPLDWTHLVEQLQTPRKILLTTHVRPDGDGLGSMLALAHALEQRGKVVRMVVASVLPPRYDFLDPQRRIQRFHLPGEEYRDSEAVLVLDTGTWNQLGDFGVLMRELRVPKFVIDHHLTQDDLGALRFVDTTVEATGRLVHDAIQALGVELTPEAAHCLFVALAMDTGWFRHRNTTAQTFALAARLTEAGADPTRIYELLFEQNTLGKLRLTGQVLERLTLSHQGKICLTEIRKDDYERTGAVPQDSEDMVNYTRSIAGVEVGLLFMEQPRGGIKVSFRSRQGVDVAKIAQQFGGGGHRLASGAILETTLEEAKARVLSAVSAALDLSC